MSNSNNFRDSHKCIFRTLLWHLVHIFHQVKGSALCKMFLFLFQKCDHTPSALHRTRWPCCSVAEQHANTQSFICKADGSVIWYPSTSVMVWVPGFHMHGSRAKNGKYEFNLLYFSAFLQPQITFQLMCHYVFLASSCHFQIHFKVKLNTLELWELFPIQADAIHEFIGQWCLFLISIFYMQVWIGYSLFPFFNTQCEVLFSKPFSAVKHNTTTVNNQPSNMIDCRWDTLGEHVFLIKIDIDRWKDRSLEIKLQHNCSVIQRQISACNK